MTEQLALPTPAAPAALPCGHAATALECGAACVLAAYAAIEALRAENDRLRPPPQCAECVEDKAEGVGDCCYRAVGKEMP